MHRIPRVIAHVQSLSKRVTAACWGGRTLRSGEILAPCCQCLLPSPGPSFSRMNKAITLTSGLEERSATRFMSERILSCVNVRPPLVSSLCLLESNVSASHAHKQDQRCSNM